MKSSILASDAVKRISVRSPSASKRVSRFITRQQQSQKKQRPPSGHPKPGDATNRAI